MPSAVDFLVAVTLLTTPPDVPEPLPAAEHWPELQAALVSLALEWEILDPRETRYVFARLEDFEENLNLVRRRYRELMDAPRLAEASRLPEHRAVNELLGFNRAYRRHLDARQPMDLDRGDLLRQAIRETDTLYQVWDAVRDARCEYYYVTVRRQALKRLRCMIGSDDFFTGTLPPFVPLWRFELE